MSPWLVALLLPIAASAAEKGGVGVEIGSALLDRSAYREVIKLLPGGPADAAGLRTYDRVLAVDHVDCRGKSAAEVAALLAGEAGSAAWVEVRRGLEEIGFRVERRALPRDAGQGLKGHAAEDSFCAALSKKGLERFRSPVFHCPRKMSPDSQNCAWYRRKDPDAAARARELFAELTAEMDDCRGWEPVSGTPAEGYLEAHAWRQENGDYTVSLGIATRYPGELAVSRRKGASMLLLAAPTR